FSIYKKMYKKHLAFEEIKDLSAIRVIVNKESECYDVLGIAHRFFRPIPNTFKDYIATPKPNMYQSLHTTILAHDGRTYEIQIRTWEMHKTSEYGIAAHWKYKEGTSNKKSKYDSKLAWLREIMDWQKDYTDSKEFMDLFKEEFANDEVFVYSPKGDVMDLPSGSTPIDFAYRVHSAVGNKCVGAKVDGKIVPLTYKLKTGNVVEILTNPNSGPSKDWLKIVKSSQAKTKIKQWFKKEQRTENIVFGRDMLEKEVAKMGYSFNELLKRDWLEEIASKLSFSSLDDLYAAIGYGSTRVTQVIPKLKEYHKDYYETDQVVNKPNHVDFVNEEPKESGVVIDGIDNVEIKLAKCCNPIPGDEIVGYITRGRGISVHRKDCSNVKSIDDKDRLIPVRWGNNLLNRNYQVELQIISFNNVGYLAAITKVISECKLNIKTFNTRTNKDKTVTINIILEISSSSEIDTVIARIKNTKGTIDVFRVNS
ncbi:MAG: RelA/SpoT family protein, partial [Finegoldia magna]|nr:RelA/SpoT family protein [Finegoldia magna]